MWAGRTGGDGQPRFLPPKKVEEEGRDGEGGGETEGSREQGQRRQR